MLAGQPMISTPPALPLCSLNEALLLTFPLCPVECVKTEREESVCECAGCVDMSKFSLGS